MTGKQPCKVSVVDDDGKRWSMEVEAASVYAAVYAYNSQQICGTCRDYPRLTPDLPVTVELSDGRKWVTTIGKANAWARRAGF